MKSYENDLGAGVTTIVKILSTRLKADGGTAEVNGSTSSRRGCRRALEVAVRAGGR